MSLNEYRLFAWSNGLPWVARMFLTALDHISHGSLKLIDPAGVALHLGRRAEQPHATLTIHDWRAAGVILRRGDIGFAECLERGWVDTPDMLALFTLALRNEGVTRVVDGHWWALLARRFSHWVLRDNSRRGSRRNILSHYDLGNAFYSLWLDPTMSYSAALFEGDFSRDLVAAQQAKYDRILDELGAQPGQTILEVGCGWGGFAERAARRGLSVVGITLSDAQLAWGLRRIDDAGLSDRVELRLQDYRDVTGQFDHIVSIEMFEAVGLLHWAAYFRMLARCLRPGGRVVVQSIDIADEHFEAYRNGTDFIQQYIFPGGMLPSPTRFQAECHMAGLRCVTTKSMGIDYAETMQRWSQAFERNLAAVRAQGFDERFIRIWRMYLAYCEAGFRESRTDVKQWTICARS